MNKLFAGVLFIYASGIALGMCFPLAPLPIWLTLVAFLLAVAGCEFIRRAD